jgi:predicted nucleotidyltransferase
MDRDAVLERLRAHQAELKAMGVARLSLFGSVARGEAGAESDVDLAAEFDPAAQVGMFRYGAIAGRLTELLGREVDLLGLPARNARIGAQIERDQVHVF